MATPSGTARLAVPKKESNTDYTGLFLILMIILLIIAFYIINKIGERRAREKRNNDDDDDVRGREIKRLNYQINSNTGCIESSLPDTRDDPMFVNVLGIGSIYLVGKNNYTVSFKIKYRSAKLLTPGDMNPDPAILIRNNSPSAGLTTSLKLDAIKPRSNNGIRTHSIILRGVRYPKYDQKSFSKEIESTKNEITLSVNVNKNLNQTKILVDNEVLFTLTLKVISFFVDSISFENDF
jgi:hypothetical protein